MENSSQISVDKGGEKQVPGWAAKCDPIDPFFCLCEFLDIETHAINTFLIEAEKQIAVKEEGLKQKIDDWKTKYHSNPEAPDAYDRYESDLNNLALIPNLLYNSVFLTAYSIFENRMFEICSICKEEFELKISARDIKGNDYLDQCKKYLEKVVEVDLSHLNQTWSDLANYRKLRNAIVHNEGTLKESDYEPVLKHFSKDKNLEIDEKNKYVSIASSSFIKTFNTLYSKYLRDLTDEITRQKNLS